MFLPATGLFVGSSDSKYAVYLQPVMFYFQIVYAYLFITFLVHVAVVKT